MAKIDLAELGKQYGIEMDESDLRGSVERLLEGMDSKNQEKDAKLEGQEKSVGELKEMVEGLVTGLKAREDADAQKAAEEEAARVAAEASGVQGKARVGVNPGGGETDPDEAKQIQDDLAQAKSLPDLLTYGAFGHPIYERAPQTREEIALQRWCDDIHLLSSVLDCDPRRLQMYRRTIERAPALRDMLNKYEPWRFVKGERVIEKSGSDPLVSDTASSGSDWVPTAFSASVWEDVRLETRLAQQFVQVDMPTASYTSPYKTGTASVYLTTQATDIGAHKFATGGATLTAVGFGCAMEFATEMDEDSIVPVLPVIREDMIKAMAEALETALINGDDSDTHQDTIYTSSADPAAAWDGLRYLTLQADLTQSIATLTVENVRLIRAAMGKYGVAPDQLLWVVSPKGYIKLLGLEDSSGAQVMMTLDKLGAQATILTGQLGALDGAPIIVSGQMREDLDASTGLYGSGQTTTSLLCVNKRAFLFGTKRPMRMAEDYFALADYHLVVMKGRYAFVPRLACTADYPCAANGIGMATTS